MKFYHLKEAQLVHETLRILSAANSQGQIQIALKNIFSLIRIAPEDTLVGGHLLTSIIRTMSDSFKVHPSYLSFPDCEPISIPELYDWHYEYNKSHPLYIFKDDSGLSQTITMGEAVQGFHTATQYVLNHIPTERLEQTPVVAILATSGKCFLKCGMLLYLILYII